MAKTKKKTTTKPIDAAGDLRSTKPRTEPNKLVVDPQSGVWMVDTGHTLPIDAFVEYENNAKIHTPEQIEQIVNSIRKFGFLDPIAIGRDNVIVEGHGRLYAARKIGMGAMPIIDVSHLSETDQRAYILAHNKLCINTGFDPERYAAEIAQIQIDVPELLMIKMGLIECMPSADQPPSDPGKDDNGNGNDNGDGKNRMPPDATAPLMLNISRHDFTVWRKFRSSFSDDAAAFGQLLLRAKVEI